MKKTLLLIIFALPFLAHSQQDVQFTQFMHNRIYYNPAVAGAGGAICLNALHRSQWVGFEGAPTTQNVNANIPIKKLGGGIGLSIVNDQIGFFSNVSARLMYAYQFQLANGTLGIGVGASFLNKSLGDALWIPSDYASPDGGIDGALPAIDANGFQIDGIFGIYYENQDFWGGLSSTRVIESTADVTSIAGSVGDVAFFKNARHYYVMGGYNWAIPATNWELRPSTLVKLTSGSTTFDLNVTGVYNNKFWGGVTYRLQDAIAATMGWQVTPDIRLGYSYDVATSALSGQGGGSHEVMVQYCFKIEIPPREKGSYKNPRFL
jgi:type IX secretion system PorP/SprF family membrane protein